MTTSLLNLNETEIANDFFDDKCTTSVDVDTFLNMNNFNIIAEVNYDYDCDNDDYSETEYRLTRAKPRPRVATKDSQSHKTSKSSLDKLMQDNNQTIEQCINDKSEMTKEDLNKIYGELNVIHQKLMVA
jgi:hypothetical protein